MANPLAAKSDLTLHPSREPGHDAPAILTEGRKTIAFPLNCSDCTWLRNEYERLERASVAAAQALTTRGRTGSARDYIALHAAADKARVNSGNALLELQRHWSAHRKMLLVTYPPRSPGNPDCRTG